MSKYNKNCKFTITFDDEDYTFTAKRMTKAQHNKIMSIGKVTSDGEYVIEPSQMAEWSMAMFDLIKENVVTHTLVRDDEGNEMSFEEMAEVVYFNEFFIDVSAAILDKSIVTKEEVKK